MMKKIAFALAFIFTVSAGFSQQKRTMRKASNMTPEQRTTLNVKRLTLALDLTKDQANKVAKLYTKMAKERTEKVAKMKKETMAKREKLMKMKKASKDNEDFKKKVKVAVEKGELKKEDIARRGQRGRDFESANNALDNMIAHQAEMKKILTKEQFEKYKKMQKQRVQKAKTAKGDKKAKMEKRTKKMKRAKRGRR